MLVREGSAAYELRIRLLVRTADPVYRRQLLVLGLYFAALLIGIYGCSLLRGADLSWRSEEVELAAGAPFLLMAFLVWLLAEAIGGWPALADWWGGGDRLWKARWLGRGLVLLPVWQGVAALNAAMNAEPASVVEPVRESLIWLAMAAVAFLLIEAVSGQLRKRSDGLPFLQPWIHPDAPPHQESSVAQPSAWQALSAWALSTWQSIRQPDIMLLVATALCSALVWINTQGNHFPPAVIALWIISAGLWAMLFAPDRRRPFHWLYSKMGSTDFGWKRCWWAYIGFALILSVGVHFRLSGLERMPPEIHGGPYEALEDAHSAAHGTKTPVIYPILGGQHLLPIYQLAALASLPGFDFDYYTAKLSSALSSVLALPFMFLLGREFIGERRRNFAIVTGLLLVGLVATSQWDVAVNRRGHDYALVSLFSALLGIFLIRAIRHNRRADFILAGLALGFGMYTDHAAYGLPLIVVAAVLVTAARQISWRERLSRGVNLAVLTVIAFMVILPMFHYMIESPDSFWERLKQTSALDRANVENAQPSEILLARLLANVRKHLLMFNWEGDPDWSLGGTRAPALSAYTGALLLLGLAALLARLLRSRDPVVWAMPAILLFAFLPAVIVVSPDAYSPSQTRTLVPFPWVYLLAALPLALMARQLLRLLPKSLAIVLGTMFCAALLIVNYNQNSDQYFNYNYEREIPFSPPSSDAARIVRGFIDSDGAAGNVFIIYSNGMPEARFVAVDAGLFPFSAESYFADWPITNVLYHMQDIPLHIAKSATSQYRFDANRDLLFLYLPEYPFATDTLANLFPAGWLQIFPWSRNTNQHFVAYRVPALGERGLNEFLAEHPSGSS